MEDFKAGKPFVFRMNELIPGDNGKDIKDYRTGLHRFHVKYFNDEGFVFQGTILGAPFQGQGLWKDCHVKQELPMDNFDKMYEHVIQKKDGNIISNS